MNHKKEKDGEHAIGGHLLIDDMRGFVDNPSTYSTITDPFGVSVASSRLMLVFEFELDNIQRNPPNSQEHTDACQQAAKKIFEATGIKCLGTSNEDVGAPFHARVVLGNSMNIDQIHHLPIDTDFFPQQPNGPHVGYEFFYDQKCPQMFFRVITTFGYNQESIDGVLAARIGFHTIETIEGKAFLPPNLKKKDGTELSMSQKLSIFKNALFVFGFSLIEAVGAAIMYYFINRVIKLLTGYYMWTAPKKPSHIRNIMDHIAFANSPHKNTRATFLCYRSEEATSAHYKQFLKVIEEWKSQIGKSSFLAPVNFSPLVLAMVTKNIWDCLDAKKRYACLTTPPGPPPQANEWKLTNLVMADKIFVNNYGVHHHSFSAKPKAWVWDWMRFGNNICGGGAIMINGVFLPTLSGQAVDLDQCHGVKKVFGSPVLSTKQNYSFP